MQHNYCEFKRSIVKVTNIERLVRVGWKMEADLPHLFHRVSHSTITNYLLFYIVLDIVFQFNTDPIYCVINLVSTFVSIIIRKTNWFSKSLISIVCIFSIEIEKVTSKFLTLCLADDLYKMFFKKIFIFFTVIIYLKSRDKFYVKKKTLIKLFG